MNADVSQETLAVEMLAQNMRAQIMRAQAIQSSVCEPIGPIFGWICGMG